MLWDHDITLYVCLKTIGPNILGILLKLPLLALHNADILFARCAYKHGLQPWRMGVKVHALSNPFPAYSTILYTYPFTRVFMPFLPNQSQYTPSPKLCSKQAH